MPDVEYEVLDHAGDVVTTFKVDVNGKTKKRQIIDKMTSLQLSLIRYSYRRKEARANGQVIGILPVEEAVYHGV